MKENGFERAATTPAESESQDEKLTSLEAFWEKNHQEIIETCRPFLDKFNKQDKSKIVSRLREQGVWHSCSALYSVLEETLDVDVWCERASRAEVREATKNASCNARGFLRGNEITIALDDDEADGKSEELALDTYGVVAHEMFHKWQREEIVNNGPRAELYKTEKSNYKVPLKDGHEAYASQFVEMEAMWFEHQVRKIMQRELCGEKTQ